MNISEFLFLSPFEQVNVLNTYGSFVAERNIGPDRAYLYAVGHFYVELVHTLSDINNRGIRIYRVFADTDRLEEYLGMVDISEVIA